MVDVNDIVPVFPAEPGWEDLHVASQHNRVRLRLLDELSSLLEGCLLSLGFLRHRHMMERDAIPFD